MKEPVNFKEQNSCRSSVMKCTGTMSRLGRNLMQISKERCVVHCDYKLCVHSSMVPQLSACGIVIMQYMVCTVHTLYLSDGSHPGIKRK